MPVHRRFITFLFSMMFILCVASACSASAQNMQGERWVIFPEEQARETGIADWFAASGESTGYWTPTEEDALAIENGLLAFLQENPDSFYSQGTPVWERLDEYNRQYLGIVLGEQRIVYANFFCASFEIDWRSEFVFVLDGGECFFQFKYDVDSSTLFDLQVNGEG